MDNNDIYNELNILAKQELDKLEGELPEDDVHRVVIFIETIRLLDCFSLQLDMAEENISVQYLDILKMGWNLATFNLFKPRSIKGFPFMQSNKKTRSYASAILYRFGCVILLRRTAEMVKTGLLLAEKNGEIFTFKKSEIVNAQFIDDMEFVYLRKLNESIKSNTNKYYLGWNITEHVNLETVINKEGNYLSFDNTSFYPEFLIPHIETLMIPLVKPWNIYPTMISYGSTEEIDYHFLVKSSELVKSWRDEAGLHPEVLINGITGAHLMSITILIVSFHLKHMSYVKIASENYPDISTSESVSIWTPLNELIQDIVLFTGFSSIIVTKALDAIIFKSEDIILLEKHSSKFMPLLMDIGNGFLIRPVSSILRNPFFSIFSILEHRYPNFKHDVSKPREEWLRTHLYAIFAGARYQTIKGNVNLRNKGITITDIDAAIFDNFTGELAIFQIKWQDFFFNDVKKLRSKASNLTRELDEWAEKITNWIDSNNTNELAKCLRLKVIKDRNITKIFLFGISKNAARMHGYGFKTKSENLAICNWPQFQRNRFEVGPANTVISKLFEVLKEQENETVTPKPLPVTFNFADKKMCFEDLWNIIDE